MPVEIGSLVVQARFGSESAGTDEDALRAELQRQKREILREVREMLAEAERRTRER